MSAQATAVDAQPADRHHGGGLSTTHERTTTMPLPQLPPPSPTLAGAVEFITALEEAVYRDEVDQAELLRLLGEHQDGTREADTARRWIRDVLLLLCSEQGASLTAMAAVYNPNRKADQVRGPAKPLERIRQEHPDARSYIQAITSRHAAGTTDTEGNGDG
jgi:hypothetical protein